MKSIPATRYLLLIICSFYATLLLLTIDVSKADTVQPLQLYSYNFSYCTTLTNATFHTFPNRVDLHAVKIVKKYSTNKMDAESMKRFACYATALGQNSYHPLQSGLVHIDPSHYFPSLTITNNTKISQTVGSCRLKPFFKIAFLILVHKDLDQIRGLLQYMYDSDALYLIHVDRAYPQLERDVQDLIAAEFDHCNVFVVSNSRHVIWGDISMVLAELEGFFQAYYMTHWDYIINMSAYCLPLRNVSMIYDQLKKEGKDIWMKTKSPGFFEQYRLDHVMIPSADLDETIQLKHLIPYTQKKYKNDQWMILSRTVIDHILHNPKTFDLLARMEFVYIPDEFFFGSLLMESPFVENIDREGKWYLEFPRWQPHPRYIVPSDIAYFGNNLFARKVKMDGELVQKLNRDV
jgi:hypothetical protein